MRVAVYGTARNEEANLDGWLDSTTGADCVVVNDTGSTDDTYELLQADPRVRGSRLPVEPMLFCNALNIALAQLPDDIDLCIRLDLDERLQPGWREELDKLTISGPTVLQPWFDHRGCTYRHDRIHTPGFRWDLPVHEILIYDGPYERVPVKVTIEHHQDLTKDRSQVLGELQAALANDPDNLRLQHYLGREYTYRADWQSAIPLLRVHAESNAFPEERSESWRLLADCYSALMPAEDVPLRPYREATRSCPERREGWVALADICHQQGRWLECLDATERALTITQKSWYFNQPFAWGGQPWHLAALASWNLGDFDAAARYGKHALDLEPDNELYRSNLDWYVAA